MMEIRRMAKKMGNLGQRGSGGKIRGRNKEVSTQNILQVNLYLQQEDQ